MHFSAERSPICQLLMAVSAPDHCFLSHFLPRLRYLMPLCLPSQERCKVGLDGEGRDREHVWFFGGGGFTCLSGSWQSLLICDFSYSSLLPLPAFQYLLSCLCLSVSVTRMRVFVLSDKSCRLHLTPSSSPT